jgi:hypothetical protein
MQHKRLILGLGAGALAFAIGGAIAVSSMKVQRESTFLTDGPSFADLNDLTKASQAVAHVKVVSASPAYVVPFDAPVVTVAPRPTEGDKGKLEPQSAVPGVIPQDTGILHTDFTVEVLDNVRGAGLKKGDRIVVTQLGGTQKDGTSASAEHDPLMQVGDQEILFLRHDSHTGKFFTTGGGQGRFKVQSNGTLSAVDSHSQLARLETGKPASSLKSAVQAIPDAPH